MVSLTPAGLVQNIPSSLPLGTGSWSLTPTLLLKSTSSPPWWDASQSGNVASVDTGTG